MLLFCMVNICLYFTCLSFMMSFIPSCLSTWDNSLLFKVAPPLVFTERQVYYWQIPSVFVWKYLYFTFISEGHFCWEQNSRMAGFFLSALESWHFTVCLIFQKHRFFWKVSHVTQNIAPLKVRCLFPPSGCF